ncbi:MAG: magnesium transporter [Janthinobacterium sp.]|jgi:magnesium transporter
MKQQDAIINCSAYKNGIKLKNVGIKAIKDVLSEDGSFVWVGLFEPDRALMRQIQDEFDLHELAVEDAQTAHERPKLEEYGDTLFLVLHTAMLVDDEVEFGETHVFLGPRFIITVRQGRSAGYARVRQRAEQMPERLASGPGYVLYSIVDFIVDQYQPCIDNLHVKFRRLEGQLFKPASQADNLQGFYKLKNDLLTLHEAGMPLIQICTQLLRFHSDIIPKDNRIYYRDIRDHVARVTHAAERMREMINAAMQVSLAQVAIRQNEMVMRLAGWGAMLAVPTMVFSLYGMNFEYMPELKWKWSYPMVLAGIAIGCFFLHRRLRRAGWL